MDIVALLGSPRASGNSAFIAGRFLEAAEKLGARTRSFSLNQLRFRGCQACDACKTRTESCVLKDDLAEVLEAVRRADVLLLASPVYYDDVTAQMKTFIDRTFCYFTPDFRTNGHRSRVAPGKTLVFVQTQGAAAEFFKDVFARYCGIMKIHGFTQAHLIRACGLVASDAARGCSDVLQLAEDTAALVVGRGPGAQAGVGRKPLSPPRRGRVK